MVPANTNTSATLALYLYVLTTLLSVYLDDYIIFIVQKKPGIHDLYCHCAHMQTLGVNDEK